MSRPQRPKKRKSISWATLAVLSALVALASGEARATGGTVTYNPPWGTSPVNVYVGRWQTDFNSYVVYQRKSDGVCSWNFIGYNGTGNTDNVVVNGTSGNDYLEIINFGSTVNLSCNEGVNGTRTYQLTSPQQATSSCWSGYEACTLTIDGQAGNDLMNCGGLGYGGQGVNLLGLPHDPIICRGGSGNDSIVGNEPYVDIDAGDGDDKVWSYQNYRDYTFIRGGNGDDCISYATGGSWTTPAHMSCDAGTNDRQAPLLVSPDCEVQVSNCPAF